MLYFVLSKCRETPFNSVLVTSPRAIFGRHCGEGSVLDHLGCCVSAVERGHSINTPPPQYHLRSNNNISHIMCV